MKKLITQELINEGIEFLEPSYPYQISGSKGVLIYGLQGNYYVSPIIEYENKKYIILHIHGRYQTSNDNGKLIDKYAYYRLREGRSWFSYRDWHKIKLRKKVLRDGLDLQNITKEQSEAIFD